MSTAELASRSADDGADRPARCGMVGCSLHGDSGCRVASGIPRSQAAWIVDDTTGGLAQSQCVLLETLQAQLHGDPGERLSRVYEILSAVATRGPADESIGIGYLAKSIANALVDERRTELGRPRCGTCTKYGKSSRLCLRRGAPYEEKLSPSTEPQKLIPPCESYSSRRAGTEIDLLSVEAKGGSVVSRLERALEALARTDPEGAAVVVEHYLEQRSLRELSRTTGVDRRRLGDLLAAGLATLGYILEDLP